MNTNERSADELLDVVRVLLLVQGAILLVTAIEAALWGAAFGVGGAPFLISVSAAVALLVARARLRPGHRGAARVVSIIEGAILVTLAVDTALALFIASVTPAPVAILTRLAIPVAVIALLVRARRSESITQPNVLIAEGGS